MKDINKYFSQSKSTYWIGLLLSCIFYANNGMCQVHKKMLQKEEYHLWGKTQINELSEKGNWISYAMIYSEGQDTLFIKHTTKETAFHVIEGKQGMFIGEKWFVCLKQSNSLEVINLLSGKLITFENIKGYKIAENKKFIVMESMPQNNVQKLTVFNIETLKSSTWDNIAKYYLNHKNNRMAICSMTDEGNSLRIIDLKTLKDRVELESNATESITNVTWQNEGDNLAYLMGDNKIVHFSLKNQIKSVVNLKDNLLTKENQKLVTDGRLPLTISNDGKRVFFGVINNKKEQEKTNVQIWNTQDRLIYPENKIIARWDNMPKIAVWIPDENKMMLLTDNNLPKGYLNGDQRYIIKYNPMTYEPQFEKEAPLDIYAQKIGESSNTLVLQNYKFSEFHFRFSPCGNFIVYFKDKNWYSYSLKEKTHRNLTLKLKTSFDLEYTDYPSIPPPYGFGGWTNENEALIYDKYDVWQISCKNNFVKKLTDGRETETCYRILKQYAENNDSNFFNRFQEGVYDVSKGLLFSVEKNERKGFAVLSKDDRLQNCVLEHKRIQQITKAKEANHFAYTEEHFNEPPKIFLYNRDKNSKRKLVETNQHHKNYYWGSSELIQYKGINDKELKGSLFYPANYDSGIKYPMVVMVYETFSGLFDKFIYPTDNNTDGFNLANLTSQGFFVLKPDITYEVGNPGISATKCVMAAIEATIKKVAVAEDKIGLMGHSFGGYETLFILTQTNRFATAIAGAAVSDLSSKYLYIDWTLSRPNYWRFEKQQVRMGKSLFEDRAGYDRNSPIANIEKINTPLLTWSGFEDLNVNPTQSYAVYAALRRLNKQNTLLLYEGERHAILNKENQVDLTNKIESWLKHYLQGKEKMDWMYPQN